MAARPALATSQDDAVTRVVVGRQGIYDRDLAVVAYELLFRPMTGPGDRPASGDQMTAEVLFRTLSLGLDHITEGRTAYCNADRGVLTGALPLTLPPEHSVVEVVESVELDDEVIDGCRRLTEHGYALAADDFTWRPGAERLLPLVDVVKIDLLATPAQELEPLIERCRAYDVRLLAEKVEDTETLERCLGLGFELFQGYVLERPRIVAGATIEPSQLGRLQQATTLLGGELDLEQVEQVVRQDPALALQLIRLASIGRPGQTRHRVNSLHEALVLAGSRRVRNWVAMLLARPPASVVDPAQFSGMLIRARACELLAADLDPALGPLGFAAGMLSAVDMLLHVSAEEATRSLSLSDDLRDAAFGGASPLGRLVRDAIDFQQGAAHPVRRSDVDEATLHAAFGDAFGWAMASLAALDDTDSRGEARAG